LILWTYIIFVRKNNFLSPSVYCPDTSKRVPRIVTATETEWRNRFVRDWIETKRAKNHDTEHCTAAFFAQGAKNYTDVKLDLLYRLILWTYIIFVRKNNFLSPSVYCPDTSKRVPRIVTATETEWRNDWDWIETKRAKNHDTLRDLNTRLSSGTSAGTFACPAGPYRNCTGEAGKKNEPN